MYESDFPALYQAANVASQKAQVHFFHALAVNLVCLVMASILSLGNFPFAWFSILQAAVLLTSLALTIYLAYKQPQRIWYSTRALSESIKTVTWRFMMRAEPYNGLDAEARRYFLQGLRKILDVNRQVCAHAVEMTSASQITEKMLEIRLLELVDRKALYTKNRIDDQYCWYKKKAALNRSYSARWFWILILINCIAIILSLVKIAFPSAVMWPTDIFVTIAGVIMAWLQTKRFQELATSYALTTHEITLLKENIPLSNDEYVFSTFVSDSENAFSREHTQWQARRDVE